MTQTLIKKHLTIVIKLGTSSIVSEGTHEPLLSTVSAIVETVCALRRAGHRVILVSSGAIGMALRRMNMAKRPKALAQVQALAAIGQSHLMALWEGLFGQFTQPVAQVLLTRTDIADRNQYLNAGNTLNALLSMGVVPIVNENDTISVAEIKFGDNDTLSAIAGGMVSADYLFLMTDVDCLYDKNPRKFSDALPVEVVRDVRELAEFVDVSSGGSSLGTGGMATKLTAARLATSAGITTVITHSQKPENIPEVVRYVEALKERKKRLSEIDDLTTLLEGESIHGHVNGIREQSIIPNRDPAHLPTSNPTALDTPPMTRSTSSIVPTLSRRSTSSGSPSIPSSPVPGLAPAPLHTRFLPAHHPIRDRYFWLLHGLAPHGTIYIDEGAYRALADGAGLLPAGVVDVDGHFGQQEAARLCVVKRLPSPKLRPRMSGSNASNGSNGSINLESKLALAATGLGLDSTGLNPAGPYQKLSPAPFEAGRVLVNYSAAEIRLIKGLNSAEVEAVLGYADSEYIALRENIAFLETKSPTSGPDAIRQLEKEERSFLIATAIDQSLE